MRPPALRACETTASLVGRPWVDLGAPDLQAFWPGRSLGKPVQSWKMPAPGRLDGLGGVVAYSCSCRCRCSALWSASPGTSRSTIQRVRSIRLSLGTMVRSKSGILDMPMRKYIIPVARPPMPDCLFASKPMVFGTASWMALIDPIVLARPRLRVAGLLCRFRRP